MQPPAHVDGRSVVVLAPSILGFRTVESGYLEFDGEVLWLCSGSDRRAFERREQEALMLVTPDNRIAECRGYDFFVIDEYLRTDRARPGTR
jgi:hypothetical protein